MLKKYKKSNENLECERGNKILHRENFRLQSQSNVHARAVEEQN